MAKIPLESLFPTIIIGLKRPLFPVAGFRDPVQWICHDFFEIISYNGHITGAYLYGGINNRM